MEYKTSEAQRRANYKYDSTLEKVTARLAAGTKKRIEKLGYSSANAFIVSAVMEKLEREENYRKGKS